MDGLCFGGGVHQGFCSSIWKSGGIEERKQSVQVSVNGRSGNEDLLRLSFVDPLKRSVWASGGRESRGVVSIENDFEQEGEEEEQNDEEEEFLRSEERRGNWVLKILQIRSVWRERGGRRGGGDVLEREEKRGDNGSAKIDDRRDREGSFSSCGDRNCEGCVVGDDDDEEFNRSSFARFLRRVSMQEAVFYARLSYLGHLAYYIPKIKPENLLKFHCLRFVTSSMEKKKAQTVKAEKDQTSTQDLEREDKSNELEKEDKDQRTKTANRISASAAYQVAASAASYLQHQTRSILPFKSPKPTGEELKEVCTGADGSAEIANSEPASFVATTNSLTAVVAAEEEVKQAVAQDLNSVQLSPCEWFVCDDEKSGTRIFVIQGSESMVSWQANLLFEPIHFEGLDVLVHRGIYEAAKGIYEQILPEVHAHLQTHDSATIRFTGHSLGGSLALLINLMLLIRREVPLSSLLPVVTYGAPTIMCGGDLLLRRLGLPRNHVQAIIMHRDIVPRAFACNYPDRVTELLKAISRNFRNHPCLSNQKMMYAPMGEILVLQPDEKIAPSHDLLPSGVGLYRLTYPLSDNGDPEKQLRAAQTVFLNSPHPLEILSDRSAYGSSGAICRDHDMRSYLIVMRSVVRQELNQIQKEKDHHHRVWWPFIASRNIHANIYVNGWMTYRNILPTR